MVRSPRLVALIPARGGSKRIPGKNVVPFFGHPMLAYTIAAAKATGLFEDVVVSTDSETIGEVAAWYGAQVVQRPAALATDEAELVDVALHALDVLNGPSVDAFCLLMPNCPLRRSRDIAAHYEAFCEPGRTFQISSVPYLGVYPHWALAQDAQARGRWFWSRDFLQRSQTLDPVSCPTGAIWWVDAAAFRAQRTFYGDPFHLAPISFVRGLDLDHPEELDLATLLVHGLQARDGTSPLEPVHADPYRR